MKYGNRKMPVGWWWLIIIGGCWATLFVGAALLSRCASMTSISD